MKAIFFILLSLVLLASTKYRDMRSYHSSRAIHHNKLFVLHSANSKRYRSLAKHFHSQAVSYFKSGVSHDNLSRKYELSARKHLAESRRLFTGMTNANREARVHLSRRDHFLGLARKYDILAQQTKRKANYHLKRRNEYLNLYNKLSANRRREIQVRNSALLYRNRYLSSSRNFLLKANEAKKQKIRYEQIASRESSFAKKDYRLYRRYVKLHKRAVYAHNVRLHRVAYKKYVNQRDLLLAQAREQERLSAKYHRRELEERRESRRNLQIVENLKDKLSNLNKEKLNTIYRLRDDIQRKKNLSERHRNNADRAKSDSKRHKLKADYFKKSASRLNILARSEFERKKKWESLYKSTFRTLRRRI